LKLNLWVHQMTANNNNNAVVINTPPPNSGTPRPRRTQSVTPVRIYTPPSTSGRPRYENQSNSNTGRPARRRRLSLTASASNLTARRLNFNNNGPGPSSPPRKPRKINVTKYEKMLKNMNTNNKNVKNNKPNNENKNVVAWLNEGMGKANKSNIPKNKRVFILPDITNNGKIKHVWDRRFLNGMIEEQEVGFDRIVPNNETFFTSPLTRKKFSKNNIKAYPPTNATKNIIRAHIRSRALEAEVNKMNGDKNILGNMKIGIQAGEITTKKQLQELEIIYQSTGSAMFMSRHEYYKAYIEGKFKPYHIKFMKDAPIVVSELYNLRITLNARMGNKTIPLYKLSSATTKYLSWFEKYMGAGSNVAYNIERFTAHTLRKIVFNGNINDSIKNSTMKEITMLKNKNLRNKLSQYYKWHERAKKDARNFKSNT